jgi:hypothetical protein
MAITNLLAVACLGAVLVVPAFAVDIRPDPDSTQGSVRIDGHSRELACDRSQRHCGQMTADRRDEVLARYGLRPGQHPDYEIDHLIPLCLGGSDDFANLWPQPRRSTRRGMPRPRIGWSATCATWSAGASSSLRRRSKRSL